MALYVFTFISDRFAIKRNEICEGRHRLGQVIISSFAGLWIDLTLLRFFKMLGTDEMRAWYGPDHVVLAADRGAIGTLLISDDLFR